MTRSGLSLAIIGTLALAVACSQGSNGADGRSGSSCTVRDNGDGTKTIACTDGTTVTIVDGTDGEPGAPAPASAAVATFHGAARVAADRASTTGRQPALAVITSATADPDGVVSVHFRVEDRAGSPVLSLATVGATVTKLVPPGPGESSSRWVSYVQRTQTVAGSGFPNPAGTSAHQAYRETGSAPRLTNHGDGTYTYVLASNLSNVLVGGVPVPYERDRTHRVTIWAGASSGWVADASFEFVPGGGAVTARRDVVRTDACTSCHGDELPGHGDSLHVESCAACHVAGSTDPHGGASLDLAVMIHKIHAGGALPSVSGPDGDPWATADNGSYAIWGDDDVRVDWWKDRFPAVLENCAKCHGGAGAQADAWKTAPSRSACGSCHDDVDFAETDSLAPSFHRGGAQGDDGSCMAGVCHGANFAVDAAHDWTVRDPRDVPEFTAELSMSPPANGQFYDLNEAPVVTLVLKRDGVALADHRIQQGTAQGCVPSGTPLACPADTDGRFATMNLFVHGPRARQMPVLTTAARAQVFSSSAGPWDLSAPGATLVLKLDMGEDVVTNDLLGTILPGTVTVPVSSGLFANPSAATTPELVAWLNGNAGLQRRAIAFDQGGRLGIRSRNLGAVHAIQLQASVVATQVFANDLVPKTPSGSTPSNTISANLMNPALNDPKATPSAASIQYQLDPVLDLAPGTYVVSVELAQLGRVSPTNYRTPTVAWLSFQVKTATPEPRVAGNCGTCHAGPDGKGLALDLPRHNKLLGDDAVDQCGACHDYQPQLVPGQAGFPTNGSWSGARPLSKRIHAVHFGSRLIYPLGTVDYSVGDPVLGRNWDITYPQDVRSCETCHVERDSWATKASRLPCMGCHDGAAAQVHMKLTTWDPTPADPWSGDEAESCGVCH